MRGFHFEWDLAAAATEAGAQLLGYTTQAQFLINCGITDVLGEANAHNALHYAPLAAEAQRLLSRLSGDRWLMASLLYGAGLRLRECLRPRVKDVDFEYRQIIVRDGKGAKDRVTLLPDSVVPAFIEHLERAKLLHERDLTEGFGDVERPDALHAKYPRAAYEWAWKFVFPSFKRSVDPRTGVIRRHHVY